MRDGTLTISDLLEPGAATDPLASIAISLRRIADRLSGKPSGAAVLEDLVPAFAPPNFDAELWAAFTRTERAVVERLVLGLKTPAIAKILGKAEGTTRVHINSVMRKAGVGTRTALVSKLYRLGGQP